MAHAEATIEIAGNPDDIFARSNDIEHWPDLFREYRGASILETHRDPDGRFAKLVFRLTNEEGQSWVSWRILDFKERIAVAQRVEPKYPFLYMHLTWVYEAIPGGVRMTWQQDFEVDPQAPFTNEQVLARMVAHMRDNQLHFKDVLEAMASRSS